MSLPNKSTQDLLNAYYERVQIGDPVTHTWTANVTTEEIDNSGAANALILTVTGDGSDTITLQGAGDFATGGTLRDMCKSDGVTVHTYTPPSGTNILTISNVKGFIKIERSGSGISALTSQRVMLLGGGGGGSGSSVNILGDDSSTVIGSKTDAADTTGASGTTLMGRARGMLQHLATTVTHLATLAGAVASTFFKVKLFGNDGNIISPTNTVATTKYNSDGNEADGKTTAVTDYHDAIAASVAEGSCTDIDMTLYTSVTFYCTITGSGSWSGSIQASATAGGTHTEIGVTGTFSSTDEFTFYGINDPYIKFVPTEVSGTATLTVGYVKGTTTTPVVDETVCYSDSASMTRPANTTAYTAGDAVGEAAPANNILTDVTATSGGNVLLMRLQLRMSETSVPAGADTSGFKIHFFNADPDSSTINDNSAHSIHADDASKYLGYVTTKVIEDVGGFISCELSTDDLYREFKCASGSTDLYFSIETDNAYTPSSEAVITVSADFKDVA